MALALVLPGLTDTTACGNDAENVEVVCLTDKLTKTLRRDTRERVAGPVGT